MSYTLYALEGAIPGVRWHCLDDDIKADLKKFFQEINGKNNSY